MAKQLINLTGISYKWTQYPIQMFFYNGTTRMVVGSRALSKLIEYARINELHEFEIFKNDTHFHSTTQAEYLIHWSDYNQRGYWYNKSEKEPELKDKEIHLKAYSGEITVGEKIYRWKLVSGPLDQNRLYIKAEKHYQYIQSYLYFIRPTTAYIKEQIRIFNL